MLRSQNNGHGYSNSQQTSDLQTSSYFTIPSRNVTTVNGTDANGIKSSPNTTAVHGGQSQELSEPEQSHIYFEWISS